MQDAISLIATFVVLVALSGIVPLATGAVASAQEVRPVEIATAVAAPEQSYAEAINIDALTLDSDFKVFMREDCPPELRLKALRKLWTLLPPPPPIAENTAN